MPSTMVPLSAVSVNGVEMGDGVKRDGHVEQASSQVPPQVAEENTKTKSVLQGKLSNLAIQIGYIGTRIVVHGEVTEMTF